MPEAWVGSNVTNTLLVLGVASLFHKGEVIKLDLLHIDIPVLLSTTVLFILMCYDTNYSWADGVFSLIGAGLYVWSVLKREPDEKVEDETAGVFEKKEKVGPTTYLMMVGSAALLYFGGEYTVDFINDAAVKFGIDQGVVAGTVVALANSLPELLIASRFAAQGKLDVAIGNVVGASIFNCLAVMGISSFFGASGHLTIAPETIIHGLPMMAASVLIFTFVTLDKRIAKTEGALFILLYIFYCGDIIGWL